MDIFTIETPSLGDRSYVVIDDDVAVVIDPQRDIDRVLALTEPRGAKITHVLETHIHNDYLTGGLVLAREVGATYVVNAADDVAYERHGVSDGDVLETGRMRIRVIATPGHTFNHLSYAVEVAGETPALFSGGSLLYGSTGRPDLLGDENAEALATAQWESAHRLLEEVPGEARLMPTHGFGSFCSATQAEGDSSTLAAEASFNPVLTDDLETFVAQTLAGLDAYPAYYVHMGPGNAAGPDEVDLSLPELADADELRQRMEAGEWVVDLRTRTAYAPGHVAGTINVGLDENFVTYVGWLMPWGTPITLLGTSEDEVAEAQRELVRIGIDRPAAAAIGTPEDWAGGQDLAAYDVASFKDLAAARERGEDPLVLDVRRNDERRESHIAGSLHVPIHELPDRIGEVPSGRAVWVHCAGGYRASIAASLLERAGHEVVNIDDDYGESVPSLGLLAEPASVAA